ncbi:arginine--tRNA ligase [Segetibacter sp. 3557_3]|uniref:arginine--tRNA ligase n=1 Tax=Segetibacter sp. 3557_3 TaxID=2547429 RepID=UPI001058F113|nr:arginine--tRNA ligase [Segetibacter sp. 3557_3]TDH28027.1 arginine--tRNA ligase [Segetibacter sp. 3557_3]
MSIVDKIRTAAFDAIAALYQYEGATTNILINATKPEFEGDYTVVLFALTKPLRKSPDVLGKELGDQLLQDHPTLFTSYNVIKGFLNLVINQAYWVSFLEAHNATTQFGKQPATGSKVMVEYSSPNTNKPLHLGHLRNNFLGWSIAEILHANGNEVIKSCIVNDRGIHICKSMIAWQMFGNGDTPERAGTKGDHFVGDYYVKFNDEYKRQVEELVQSGIAKELAEKEAPIMKATQEMLQQWEQGDPDVMELWTRMNSWVYAGFDVTYKRIGSDFDKVYYESQTYLLGKDIVEKGLETGILYKKNDGSVWIDLTADGLDEKLVLRKDGTSVYITQDLGLAQQKYEQFGAEESIYVVGDEQNYHMKVLKLILQKFGAPYANGIHHLSYGMVELPTGKMKSREGTVVDADDILDEMITVARGKTEELGKVKDFNPEELSELYNVLGLSALKFFLLRVDPKKKMVFNPEESIDFHGFTGPFVQYTHARIKSVLRKIEEGQGTIQTNPVFGDGQDTLLPLEKQVISQLEQFPVVVREAGSELDPSKIAIYVFNLAKGFNAFYTEHSIANAETPGKKALRLKIASLTASVIAYGMHLLGISVPERM